ncbi:MAG: nucleotidyltransferase domain-containing protein [bacterium]
MPKILYKDLLRKPEYEFMRAQYLNDNLGFLIISGSNSFGTNLNESDLDIRGFVYETQKEILLVDKTKSTYVDEPTDTTIYKFNHFIDMLSKGNTTQIEYLGVEDDCIIIMDNVSEYIINNRKEFLTRDFVKRTYGYILSDIKHIEKYKSQLIKENVENIINPDTERIFKKINKKLAHIYRLIFTLKDFYNTGDIITNRGSKINYLLDLRKGVYIKDINKYGVVRFENSINAILCNIKSDLDKVISKLENKQIKENVNIKFVKELVFEVNLATANNQNPCIKF